MRRRCLLAQRRMGNPDLPLAGRIGIFSGLIPSCARAARSPRFSWHRRLASCSPPSTPMSWASGVCRCRRCHCWRAPWGGVEDLIGQAPSAAARKRGPTPKLVQYLERISALTKPRHRAVMGVSKVCWRSRGTEQQQTTKEEALSNLSWGWGGEGFLFFSNCLCHC